MAHQMATHALWKSTAFEKFTDFDGKQIKLKLNFSPEFKPTNLLTCLATPCRAELATETLNSSRRTLG